MSQQVLAISRVRCTSSACTLQAAQKSMLDSRKNGREIIIGEIFLRLRRASRRVHCGWANTFGQRPPAWRGIFSGRGCNMLELAVSLRSTRSAAMGVLSEAWALARLASVTVSRARLVHRRAGCACSAHLARRCHLRLVRLLPPLEFKRFEIHGDT